MACQNCDNSNNGTGALRTKSLKNDHVYEYDMHKQQSRNAVIRLPVVVVVVVVVVTPSPTSHNSVNAFQGSDTLIQLHVAERK